MKQSKKQTRKYPKGFTLIELLVVVLIIGILAAVALPQYQKAVKKAQGREVLVALDALDKGVHEYVLENGKWEPERALRNSDLAVQMPTLKHFRYVTVADGSHFDFRSWANGSQAFFSSVVGDSAIFTEWDSTTGKRTNTYCKGKNCKDYFDCISENADEHCVAFPTDQEHCPAGAWQTTYYCYLD